VEGIGDATYNKIITYLTLWAAMVKFIKLRGE
jgi:hypothetical protein